MKKDIMFNEFQTNFKSQHKTSRSRHLDQDFHTISNGGLKVVAYNANSLPLPPISTPNLTPPLNVVSLTTHPQPRDVDNANNQNIKKKLKKDINYNMDNKLLFDVDTLMDAFYNNIDNHQMDQDAHERNVSSFSDSTLQIRKSSRISKPIFKVKDNVD
jgi:hypothetical protein